MLLFLYNLLSFAKLIFFSELNKFLMLKKVKDKIIH